MSARPGRRSLNRRERASSNADGRYAAQGAGDGPHRRGSLRLPHCYIARGRTSWHCARSTTSDIPPSASPRRGTSGSASVAARRRTRYGSCATWRDAASRRRYAYWHVNTISRWKRPPPLVVSGGGTSGKRCCWRTPRSPGGLLPGDLAGTARTEADRQGLEETYRSFGVGLCPPDVPQAVPPLPRPARLPDTHHRGTGGRVRRTEPYPVGEGAEIRQLPRQSRLPQGAYPLRPAQGGESHTLRGTHPALRGIQGRARLPRLRHTVRRGAMRHGAHRGAYPGDTEAGRAGDALSRSRSGGTAEHGPVRPYATVRGVRRQPASPTRRHGPGRGIPPERERRAGTPSTGGYPRLPLLPHPPSGFPPSHGHHRHQRGVGRDRPPLLPAGRVPEAWGAIRGDGYTDGGITAGNVCRHRPEKRSGSGTEEGNGRPHARPATRKGVTAFLPHAP